MRPRTTTHPVTRAERKFVAALERETRAQAFEAMTEAVRQLDVLALTDRRKREDEAIASQIPVLPW